MKVSTVDANRKESQDIKFNEHFALVNDTMIMVDKISTYILKDRAEREPHMRRKSPSQTITFTVYILPFNLSW